MTDDNFGTTVIWKLGPPIPEARIATDHRRRESERVAVYWWTPDAEDVSAAVTFAETLQNAKKVHTNSRQK